MSLLEDSMAVGGQPSARQGSQGQTQLRSQGPSRELRSQGQDSTEEWLGVCPWGAEWGQLAECN